MKKFVFLALMATVFTTCLHAQKPKPEFGIKAGLNMANIYGDNGESYDMRIGFHGGIFAEFYLSERLGLQPELQYSMQGSKAKVEGFDATLKLDYINLPVLLKIYFGSKRAFSLDAGLQFGTLVSSKYSVSVGDASVSASDSDIVDNKFDAGIAIGVSYKFAERFHAGFRVNTSVTKLFDDFSDRNGVGQLFLGFRF
jgi:hypothetical protein